MDPHHDCNTRFGHPGLEAGHRAVAGSARGREAASPVGQQPTARPNLHSPLASCRDASHSRKAWFIRVCQPAPVRLKAASTSVSTRMLTWALGAAEGGRPRRGFNSSAAAASPSNPDSTSSAGRARANQAASASGASSSRTSTDGLRGVIANSFAPAGSAQTDHVNHAGPGGEDHHVELLANQPEHLVTRLRVSTTLVLGDQGRGPVQQRHLVEAETPLGDVAFVLVRIVAQTHLLVPTKIRRKPGTHSSRGHFVDWVWVGATRPAPAPTQCRSIDTQILVHVYRSDSYCFLN